mmetsp:Transcript_8977/g.22649  ORF Transcript_8977/g.22649 Transcript_8977/m.22649 type:complete len:393 (-) Transcript_8977:692-1870(-)
MVSSSRQRPQRPPKMMFAARILLSMLIVIFATIQLLFVSTRIPQPQPQPQQKPQNYDESSTTNSHFGAVDGGDEGESGGGGVSELPVNTTTTTTNAGSSSSSRTHAIPRILIFTHYKDLLHGGSDLSSNDEEEQVLAANIRHSIDIHNNQPQVRFLTDDDCIRSLQKVYPTLIDFFLKETEGMYKGDVCRGAALYETGGIYLDVDVGVRHDLWQDLKPTTQFVTSFVHRQSHYPGHFFQAILGSERQSPILLRYLRLFEKHYQAVQAGDTNSKDRIKKGPLGVIFLKRAWDDINKMSKKDVSPSNPPKTELYQEVLFHPKLFPDLHPAPTWGTRRACHFVVIAKVNFPRNKEMTMKNSAGEKKLDIQIPLYSRIAGSRMCPIMINNTIQSDG